MMALDDGLVLALKGRYEIEREIGQGGMAVVYLARDVKLNRRVALKVLRPELANSLGSERFLQEIAIAAPLVHPNILPLHDSGEAGGHLYYVMPYVEGMTLRQRLQRETQLSVEDTLTIVRQIASALDHAHAHGVVHRDIKPENILLLDEQVLVADFGLAKAITRATSQPLTQVGIVVGTPEYMSPEQATPGDVVDARSDIYSLACVTFEMIAGMPPFRGANAQAVIAHHVMSPPPPLCEERHSCPPEVEIAVRRAMSKVPADRFRTAGEFVRALGGGTTPLGNDLRQVVKPPRSRGTARRRRLAMSIAFLGAVAVAGVAAWRWWSQSHPSVSHSAYVVLPFRHVGAMKAGWLDGDGCARLLQDAISQWRDVRVADDMIVNDLWARRRPRTVKDAISAARSLGAGWVTWGTVIVVGDTIEVRATLYDVEKPPSAGQQVIVRMAGETASLDSVFHVLAGSLLVGKRLSGESFAASRTKNVMAARKFLEGREAMGRFDLRTAERRFGEATALDDGYAIAQLWRARTLAWGGLAAPQAWEPAAAQAVARSSTLAPGERQHAAALLHLATGRMLEACASYRALIRVDSSDFGAWLGLGDCQARDTIVIRDRRSPSGWSFRGSYHTAIRAYRKALSLVPSFHAAERGATFDRLSKRVLFIEELRRRPGSSAGPDPLHFVALPSFEGDTLAFVPHLYSAPGTGGATQPPTNRRAIAWSIDVYRQLMSQWVSAFPTNAEARESHSLALEVGAAIPGRSDELTSALLEAHQARILTDSAAHRVRLANTEVRLLLKTDDMEGARLLADSVLKANTTPSAYEAGYLSGLAALTGRASMAAHLSSLAASEPEHLTFYTANGNQSGLPLPLLSAALALQGYAALGGPRDSLRAVFTRVEELIIARVPSTNRAETRAMLYRQSFGLAFDELAPLSRFPVVPGRNTVLAMHLALAAGDTGAVVALSGELRRRAALFAFATPDVDRLYQQARVLVAIGNDSLAARVLDDALDGIPRARRILLTAVPQAGALPRAMVLRAELAQRAGDRATFERWARRAITLLSSADGELRRSIDPLRRSMRSAQRS